MPTEVIMPKVDMDMEAGTIAAWHVAEGETVEKGDALFDIETDKAAMEVESPASGTLRHLSAQAGDTARIGDCIAWIFADGEVAEPPNDRTAVAPERSAEPSPAPAAALEQTSPAATPAIPSGKIRATPLARRLARLNGIDLSTVRGSGPRGRISRKDVEAAEQTVDKDTAPTAAAGEDMASKDRLDALGIAYDIVSVDKMRARIARRLIMSKASVPHFYLEADCRIDALLEFRRQINEALAVSQDGKVSINDLLVRASALALKAVPDANVSWAGDEILRYRDANVSVAVSVEGGLVTPVVRRAQDKSILTISREVADLADRAKARRLAGSAYQGGSFTISNLGMFGVKAFSAIINPPESMILAVGKANRQFIEAEDGSPVAATVLPVRLSCDHRVVDGALGAKWLNTWQGLVENPPLLAVS